ncbi:MAG: double zinc ribbon domain-containing protein [Candidatus Hodarchaeales archaeon]|jgi:rRNA maturation endonuclease Nob1
MPNTEREELVTCNNCKNQVPTRPFCINCGKPLKISTRDQRVSEQEFNKEIEVTPRDTGIQPEKNATNICLYCSKPVPNKFSFCIYCGKNMDGTIPDVKSQESTTKFCPYCKKTSKRELQYCISCGKPLINISLRSQRKSHLETASAPFKGFSVPVLSTGSNVSVTGSKTGFDIPGKPSVSILKPTFQNRSASGVSSVTSESLKSKNVKSLLFTITAPQRVSSRVSFNKSFIGSFKSYVITAVFVFFVYVFWYFLFFEGINLELINEFPLEKIISIILLAIPNSLFVTAILLLPVITLSYKTYYKHEITVVYSIEPAIIILTVFTNIIITFLALFIPLIMLPGDIKMKQLPPKKEIGSGLGLGVTACVIATSVLGLVVFMSFVLSTATTPVNVDVLVKSLQITFIMSSWVCLITLLPFGNVLGKMVQEWNFKRFLLLLTVSTVLILYSFALAGLYR